MKNLIKIALIISIFGAVSFAQQCFAQTVSVEQFKSIVEKQAKQDLLNYDLDDCEVSVGNLPINSFELPDGKVTVEIVNGSNGLMAREFKKININVNGNYVRTYYAPIETKHLNMLQLQNKLFKEIK